MPFSLYTLRNLVLRDMVNYQCQPQYSVSARLPLQPQLAWSLQPALFFRFSASGAPRGRLLDCCCLWSKSPWDVMELTWWWADFCHNGRSCLSPNVSGNASWEGFMNGLFCWLCLPNAIASHIARFLRRNRSHGALGPLVASKCNHSLTTAGQPDLAFMGVHCLYLRQFGTLRGTFY